MLDVETEEAWNPNNLDVLAVPTIPEDGVEDNGDSPDEGEKTIAFSAADEHDSAVLLEKFLDLQHPVVMPKMYNFLLQEGMCERLFSYISRLPGTGSAAKPVKLIESDEDISEEEEEKTKDAPTGSANGNNDSTGNADGGGGTKSSPFFREREWDGESLAMRRSYNAVMLVIQPSKTFASVLHMRVAPIVLTLFDVFDPRSDGNFHHFRRCIDHILRTHPEETLGTIVAHGLLRRMLDYLHIPAVVATVVQIMRQGPKSDTPTVIPQGWPSIFDACANEGFADVLVAKLTEGNDEEAAAAAGFIARLAEEVSLDSRSSTLFAHLASSSFIHRVPEAAFAAKATSAEQQKECVSVLVKFLRHKKPTPPPGSDTIVPITVEVMREPLLSSLAKYIDKMGALLLNGSLDGGSCKLAGHHVPSSLTTFRINVASLLRELVDAFPRPALDQFPGGLMRRLGSWVLTNRFNNIYHTIFFDIYKEAVMVNHEATLKCLLAKGKFLSKAIDHYLSPQPSGARGWLLLMFNLLRLKADMLEKTDYLHQLLLSNDKWRNFLPTLRAATEGICQPFNNVQQYLGTTPFPHVIPASDYAPETEMYTDDGIDLGSSYAKMLGFHPGAKSRESCSPLRTGEVDASTPTAPSSPSSPSPNPSSAILNSSTTSNHESEASDDFLEEFKQAAQNANQGGGGGGKKKKNKKKNKKK